MIDKPTNHISAFYTRYTMFWALYTISTILITIGLIIEICTGEMFTSTIMLILLAASILCSTLVFNR